MTNEQKVLLKLVGSALNGKTIEKTDFESVDWLSVAVESDIQAVLPIAFDAASLLKQNISSEVYKLWSDRAVAYLVKNAMVQRSQTDLVKLLDDAGYPYAILKGEASAGYYPRPELRTLGDVDFVIDVEQNEVIKKLLCDNGYTSFLEDHECHIVFKKPNSHLEMHREISGIPHGEIGEKVREFTKDILNKREKKDGFYAPEHSHHGLILLLHTQHHLLGEGIGLRHLCDWAAFVNATQKEPFWQEKLLPFLNEIGLLTLAKTLTKTSAVAFELACPEWADADETLCLELIADVFSGGNFGRKEGIRSLSGALISNRGKDPMKSGKWSRLYKVFSDSVKTGHPITKKYPILYPIYAVYKAIRFFVLCLLGKKRSLTEISRDIDKRKSIYQRLKIFEV